MTRSRLWTRALTSLQALLSLSASYGAAGLVLGFDGFDMPADWLKPLPLDSWVLPGLALQLIVALPLAAAALATGHHDRRAPALSWTAAGLLLAWLVVEFAVMGVKAPIQVITLVLAVALVALTAHTARSH